MIRIEFGGIIVVTIFVVTFGSILSTVTVIISIMIMVMTNIILIIMMMLVVITIQMMIVAVLLIFWKGFLCFADFGSKALLFL